MTPRLIAYLVSALGLAVGLWWVSHTVSQWREAYRERPALIAARDAAVKAQEKSEQAVQAQVARNQEIERETNDALRRAGIAARDLADRLLHYQTTVRRPICPATPAAGDPHGTAGEPAGGGEVEAAATAYFEAAARDAERLSALQGYVRGLPARCVPD